MYQLYRKINRKLFEKYHRQLSPYCSVASLYFWTVAVNQVVLPECRLKKIFCCSIHWRKHCIMKQLLNEDLTYEILSVVEEIPVGKVASYGQIARLIGRDKNSRLVGKVLSRAEYYGDYPCHRVVNHKGRLAPHFYGQRNLLLDEGVEFKDDNHVDMKKCQWDS